MKTKEHYIESDQEVLVRVEGVSKKFAKSLKKSLLYGVHDLWHGILQKPKTDGLRPDEFWAVKDVSFELRRGECLGLIGHNGAGKSTLLKILNGLINPDDGVVTMKGRVGALIELGAGFNPILTGRENIYNNGAVLGFTKKEIDNKVEAIIDFAEIQEFIDMPVRNYSSGMKVRLGFAVAAQMEPDVLIIDEVLAVGDIGFRVKCFNRIAELLNTCAVIFVSHSMPQIARVSTHVMHMKKGAADYFGTDISVGLQLYHADFNTESTTVIGGDFVVNDFKLIDAKGFTKTSFEVDETICLKLEFSNRFDCEDYFISVVIMDANLNGVASLSSLQEAISIGKSTSIVEISFKNIFTPGQYSINVNFIENVPSNDYKFGKTLCSVRSLTYFKSTGGVLIGTVPVQIDSNWKV
ncbi:ABC transporter ATP-binding protein [Aestuariibaculum sp. M13]|uniref:ABC transporter ATP-binding protein n=1 Tax=Aestuariibaculum sp. M13 TaxID=2967132 RepID=UPI00215A0174|nr:ABC transporter ATP-binding protein [Aestuariibaculum sp. M13]MCR8666371.1 ABC transporter ATP-binding protein [Aestuariibaculum sp. M13]